MSDVETVRIVDTGSDADSADAANPERSGMESIDRVVLEVPATTDHLRMVRLMVSALATSHGADLNDLEDLRIASGELCAHLVNEASRRARMTVSAEVFATSGSSLGPSESPLLLLRAIVPGEVMASDFDDISSMVLAAASEGFGIGPHPDRFPTSENDKPTRTRMEANSSAWFSRRVRATAVSPTTAN